MAEGLPEKGKVRTYKIKSCCGSANTIVESDRPLRKSQVKVFKDNGYFVPDNFFQAGVFYAQLGTLIATASYGTNRFSIRCSGNNCEKQMVSFQEILEKATHS